MTAADIEADGDPAQLAVYVKAIAPILKDHEDSSYVRKTAETLAAGIDKTGRFGLGVLARTIPTASKFATGFDPHRVLAAGAGKPILPRNQRTDEGVEKLLTAINVAINAIAVQHERADANSSVPTAERRKLALRAVSELDSELEGNPMWCDDVRWRAELSVPDTRDALEHWSRCGAIRSAIDTSYGDSETTYFRLTSYGRDIAAGETPTTIPVGIEIHNYGPAVQQIGNNNAANFQIIGAAVSDAIEQIRKHLPEYSLDERDEIESHLEALQEEANGSQRPSRIKAALKAIQRVTIEGQKAFAPTISAIVSGVVSGLSS